MARITKRTVYPLRLLGAVALPDGRAQPVDGDSMWELYRESVAQVDQGQPVQPDVVAVSNSGPDRAA